MSATGVPDRILMAYFVELDPIIILEKTVREKLSPSQSYKKPKMVFFRQFLSRFTQTTWNVTGIQRSLNSCHVPRGLGET